MEQLNGELSRFIEAIEQQDFQNLIKTLEPLKKESSLERTASHFLHSEILFVAIQKRMQIEGNGSTEDPMMEWLYHWYQMDSTESKQFVLSLVPILIWYYLVENSRSHCLAGIEACLLCIYNVELGRRGNKEKRWNPPNISWPSYWHYQKPSLLQAPPKDRRKSVAATHTSLLTENLVKQLEVPHNYKPPLVSEPLPIITAVGKRERDLLVLISLQRYVDNFGCFPSFSRKLFCETAAKLVASGFPFEKELKLQDSLLKETMIFNKENGQIEHPPQRKVRIILTSSILQTLLYGITHAFSTSPTQDSAYKALEAIHYRASYELLPEVLLITNALFHIQEVEDNTE